jgi:hypothetical protein
MPIYLLLKKNKKVDPAYKNISNNILDNLHFLRA